MSMISRATVCLSMLLTFAWPAAGQPVAARADATTAEQAIEKLAADLHEEIARIKVGVTLPGGKPYIGDMVVTHYKPDGPGPFPVIVHSHGRAASNRHDPARWRAIPTARYWVRRGFAVLVPTRIGYGELGQENDPEHLGSCTNPDHRQVVAAMATQIAAAAEFARGLPWVDGKRIVLSGISYGGFGTIGASARSIPGVVGAINFVGGLGGDPKSRPGEPCQGTRIAELAADLGARTRIPMLWLYAENDKFWGAEWPQRWYQAFTEAGGNAQLASFGAVGEDGHKLPAEGFVQWRPVVDRYVRSLGFELPKAMTALGPTGFARLDEIDKVPYIKPEARTEGYAKFLVSDVPRAFVISPTGAWAWRSSNDAVEVALGQCQKRSRTPCNLYAVDDRVVWKDGRK